MKLEKYESLSSRKLNVCVCVCVCVNLRLILP